MKAILKRMGWGVLYTGFALLMSTLILAGVVICLFRFFVMGKK